jgi:hypothetical protein
VGRKSFQIRRNTRAAAGIEARDRQQNRRHGDALFVKMAHVGLSLASFRDENSRSRSPVRNLFALAPENARHLRMYAHSNRAASKFW